MITFFKTTIQRFLTNNFFYGARDFYRYIRSLKYGGDKYECPLCNGRFCTFFPTGLNNSVLTEKKVVGGGYRLNAICPRCCSVERERLIYLFLKRDKNSVLTKKISLLHIAPERMLSKKLKALKNIQYLSADLDPRLGDVQMDITNIEQDDATYDVIICNHVLEHIEDDLRAMRELFRVLKNGGFAILQVPISYFMDKTIEDFSIKNPKEKEAAFGQKDHVRIYGSDYIKRLESVGFSVTVYDFAGILNPRDIYRYGLLKNEKIFLCEKLK